MELTPKNLKLYKLCNIISLILLLLIPFNLFSQDTIAVYFDFGSSKIKKSEFAVLNSIPEKYDLSTLEMVEFIGMTDSIGENNYNKDLSDKRAANVAAYCKSFFIDNLSIDVKSIGKVFGKKIEKNRCVFVILYFQNNSNTLTDTIEKNKSVKEIEKCFNIDYKLLHRCHTREIIRDRKKYIMLEIESYDYKVMIDTNYKHQKMKQYYSASLTKDSNIIINKVHWTIRKTGNLWWSDTRYTATILKKDYEKFKIFTVKDPPCNECSELFQTTKKITKSDSCIQVDRFLMNNIQFRRILFNNKMIRVRAPREFVNLEDRYYIGCGLKNRLIWEIKESGRKKNYYFSKLTINNTYSYRFIDNITRVMDCCKSNPEPSECNHPFVKCSILEGPSRNYYLNLDIGSYYQKTESIRYAKIGISKAGEYSQMYLMGGVDKDLKLINTFTYQFYFLSFSFNSINPFSYWESPSDISIIDKYCRLYTGTELKTQIGNSQINYFDQNFHVGIAVVDEYDYSLLQRIYLQFGKGINYLNKGNKMYPIVQFGINLKLVIHNVNRPSFTY